jgi:hypothetical protein
LERAAN